MREGGLNIKRREGGRELMREGGRLIIIDRLVLSHYIIVHTCVMVHGIMVNGHVTWNLALELELGKLKQKKKNSRNL